MTTDSVRSMWVRRSFRAREFDAHRVAHMLLAEVQRASHGVALGGVEAPNPPAAIELLERCAELEGVSLDCARVSLVRRQIASASGVPL